MEPINPRRPRVRELDLAALPNVEVILPPDVLTLSAPVFDRIVLEWLPETEPGRPRWRLHAPVAFTLDWTAPGPFRSFVVPAGFEYDLATFPPAAYVVAGLLGIDRDALVPAATAHDWSIEAVEAGTVAASRHDCDRLFREVVRLTAGLSASDAHACYLAVRGASVASSRWFRALARAVPSVALALLRRG